MASDTFLNMSSNLLGIYISHPQLPTQRTYREKIRNHEKKSIQGEKNIMKGKKKDNQTFLELSARHQSSLLAFLNSVEGWKQI